MSVRDIRAASQTTPSSPATSVPVLSPSAPFAGRMLMLGCGSVAQCVLPLYVRHLGIPANRITVMDFDDHRDRIAAELAAGVQYVEERITPENLGAVLGQYVTAGDVLIDLAWNIDCREILQWCHDHGVRYLNTSVELWDPYEDASRQDPRTRSLYVRHQDVARLVRSWGHRGPTAVLEHGANPGLVSHLTKRGLVSIANRALSDGRLAPAAVKASEDALASGQFNRLAHALGVKVIHIAERDTQITDRPKELDEFVNTWSVDGLYEEGVAPAELGWGTHEIRMPEGAYVHQYGPANQIALNRMGIDTLVRSWTPLGEIVGMVVRHGEAYTISDHLTVWEGDRPAYRPTVHYAYCPADVAWASLLELRARHLVMQSRQRIMNNEILPGGADAMGVLLMGHPYRSWWTGSVLTIDEARGLLPGQSATTLQVAASILGATRWILAHPEEGVCVPDDLPWETVLADALPYLGRLHDEAADWGPLDQRPEVDLFGRYDRPRWRAGDPDEDWQFTSFLV